MENLPTVHVVNPDEIANSVTLRILSSLNIYARTYQTANELFRQGQFSSPCCFLISFLLADGSGTELMRKLRANGIIHPCIFTSIRVEPEFLVKAMNLGGYGYIKNLTKRWSCLS